MRMRHIVVAMFFISTAVHAQVVLVSDLRTMDAYSVSQGYKVAAGYLEFAPFSITVMSGTNGGYPYGTAVASQTSVISPPSFQATGTLSLESSGGDAAAANQYGVTFDLLSSASYTLTGSVGWGNDEGDYNYDNADVSLSGSTNVIFDSAMFRTGNAYNGGANFDV
jgi:hypothetical protein